MPECAEPSGATGLYNVLARVWLWEWAAEPADAGCVIGMYPVLPFKSRVSKFVHSIVLPFESRAMFCEVVALLGI